MEEEALHVYDELSRLRLISDDFYCEMKRRIAATASFTTREVFSYALELSIAGMVRTSASFGFEEEHLTASLAGSLAANLTWFARAYIKSRGLYLLPYLQWVHQTKNSEGRSGIDFGILARVPGSEKRFRLVLVQAKLGDPEDMSIKVDHVTNAHLLDGKLELSSDAATVLAAAAHLSEGYVLKDRALLRRAADIAQKKFEPSRYQLETILRTDFRGQSLSGDNRPWCFYVVWHATKMPQAVDARTVASTVWTKGAKFPIPKVTFSDASETLTSILDEAFYQQNSRYGLEFSLDELGEAVKVLAEAAPNAALLTNSPDLELKKIFRQAKYTTSDTLIPDAMLQRQWRAVMAARTLAAKRLSEKIDNRDSSSSMNLSDDVEEAPGSGYDP